ncbi:AAA family ATPase [Cohnella sp. WQ 127256]|uniref:AAA family ATPase n=1 Tax=Cohnella sp. WQ 127256 TaxID=2938790 RepID=UPI0021187269|nr:AAA family ATPase [Cohnella sp. WQ 127256]
MRDPTIDAAREFDMMFELQGYRTIEMLGSQRDISLYRLQRYEDRLSVIAMTTRDGYPDEKQVSAFHHQYDMLRKLDGKGALEAYSLETESDRPVLLLQDIGGNTLDQIIRLRGDDAGLSDLLRVAIAVADSLMQIHREKVTLHEITPSHILVNPETCEAKFVDIRLCSDGSDKSPLSSLTDRPDFVLPYISPEQTGRTGGTPDYRSDFYSLGVTLYEWLSGSLPFEIKDVMNIVYHHLAIVPQPLHNKHASIPRTVSDIIGKCMEKSPNTRYESAYGLKSDLDTCLAMLERTGRVESFPLAERDIPNQLTIPSWIYGRSSEQACLLNALKRAAEETVELVEVSGGGGIGKTFFVMETLRKAVPKEGLFAKGKFDPHRAPPPYDVWIQAIGELVGQLLTESTLQIEVWKLRILDALEGYAQILVERVPKLELLIGPQPFIQPLPPLEAQRRFHLILNRFFQLFAFRDRPLVLFLDDLQWADEASLQYLAHLLEDWETKHLLVVAAYREEEFRVPHTLSHMETRLAKRGATMSRIHLNPLLSADLKHMLSDTMRDIEVDTDDLVSVLLQKTDGNPLFLKQILQDLFEAKLIKFDEYSGRWLWSLLHISETNVADNTAAYISVKLKHLPSSTARVLSRAAFLGSPFALESLLPFVEYSADELSGILDYVVREGYLQVFSEVDKQYKFQHDRIQQAAYALLDDYDRSDLHLRIGMSLAQRMRMLGDVNEFEVVNHLNRALNHFERPEQKLELADLNLQAGLKAKQSTAYETALVYMRHAMELLVDVDWDKNYTLAFRVFRERAELEFLCSNFDGANEMFQLLLTKATSNMDKALVYNIMIRLESSKDNYAEVISLGLQTLALFNIRLHRQSIQLLRQGLRLNRKLRKHTIESITCLPPMTNEVSKITISTLVHTSNALFFMDKKGWLAATFMMVEMTLDEGMSPEASIGFVGYAMYQCFSFHRLEEAFKWGMLAYELSRPYPILHVKTLTAFSLCHDSWRKYKPELLDTFSEHAGKVGLESGDLWQGNQSVLISCGLMFQFGYPIREVYDRMLASSGAFRRHNNELLWKQATILVATFERLTGFRATGDPYPVDEVGKPGYSESVHGDNPQLIEELVCGYHYIPDYIFGRYQEANEWLKKSAAILASRPPDIVNTHQFTYEALVWAQLFEELPTKEQRACWSGMRERLKRLHVFAKRCPESYWHNYLLIKAEMARLKGKSRQAEQLYAESIEWARTYGQIHSVAIAAECCGKYGLRQGKLHLAKIYLTEAYESYLQWGATVKAADMEQQYGHLLNIKRESGIERIDYLSVAQSAQVLSGEMEMGNLLDTMMRTMLQNAGADFGALLFEQDGGWTVEVFGTAEELNIGSIPIESIPIEEFDLMPAAIVGYSIRTREEVVLHDAAKEGMFTRNPYVRNNGVKSILCLPIMHQNKLICVLYLENKLSPNLFTSERLDVLKLLAAQSAISIANAKLFTGIQELKNSLEDQVEERTRSLERSMLETSAALAEVSVYEERNRIAQEIHDIVGHTLTSTVIQIEAGKRLMSKDAGEATQRLKEAQDLVRHGLNEIRGSVHMLKEDRYSDLATMLNQLMRDTERNTGVVISSELEELIELPTTHKKTIYHALQEGLTNGIRHGGSAEFRFSLHSVDSNVCFRLEDFGKGSEMIKMGFGLRAMNDRVEQLGGTLAIDSRQDQGCLLKIDLPYPSRKIGDMK